MGVPQEVSLSGANPSLAWRELEVVLAETAEKCGHVANVGEGVFIEADNIVQVRFDAFQTVHHLVDHLHEPSRAGVGALGHAQKFEQLSRGAESSEGHSLGVRHDLVEGRVEVEDGEHLALVQRIQDAINAGKGLSVHVHQRVEAFVVDGDTHGTIFLGNHHERRSPRGSGVLDETSGQVLVEDSIHLLLHDGVDAVGLGRHRLGPRRQRKRKRHDVASTEIRLGSGEHVRVVDEGSTKPVDGFSRPAWVM